jgi:hypothetical protein
LPDSSIVESTPVFPDDIASVYFSSAFSFGRTFDIIVILPTVITNFALYDMKLLAIGRGYEIKKRLHSLMKA